MRYARSGLSLILGTLLVLTAAASAATTLPPVAIPWEQAATQVANSVTYADGRFVAVGGPSVLSSTGRHGLAERE